MKPTEENKYEDARLKELFRALPSEEMPPRLQSMIVQQAAERRQARLSRRSDMRGLIWAGVAMVGIVVATILLLRYLNVKISMPTVDIAAAVDMPQIEANTTTPIWLIAAAGALILLMGDTLLRRHIRNRAHKMDL